MNLFSTYFKARALFCLAVALAAAGTMTEARSESVADVMVGYSATWRAGMGGTDQTNAAIYNQFAGSNNIAAASGSPHRQNVIGTKESAHDPTNEIDCGAMIGWLRNYNVNIRDVVDMGNALGADLFAYIGDMYDNGAAAQAEQPGRFSCYEQAWWWQNIAAHESGGHNFGLAHAEGRTGPTTIMMHNYCGGGSQGFYSNPNIWLGGVQLIGGMSGCTYVGGSDSAYHLSTTAQGEADTAERTVWGSKLAPIVHRWQFNQAAGAAPAGTTVTSSVGGALATVRGQGATFTGAGLRLPGGTTGNVAADSIAAYLDLPNGIFKAMPSFTIEIWATPLSAQNWMRVIDIGRATEAGDGLGAAGEYTGTAGSPAPGDTSSYDDLMVSACTGTNLNGQRFEAKLAGTAVTADSSLATTAGEMHHYAITFADTTSGGTIKWFRDGVLVKTLTVGFHSASLQDVNNWLGRSQWSGDAMANMDYHDVRIIGAALADGQIAGNYRIGPHDAVSTQWANDAFGNSSFLSGAWEFGATPVATRDYETGTMRLRTPANSSNPTFPGRSLTLTGGSLILKGTAANITTVNDLRLAGGTIIQAVGGNTQTVAGNILAKNFTDNHIRGGNGPLVISANITGGVGGGRMLYTENAVTLTGNNSGYLGATIVGDGRFSTLKISNETQLGGNPTFYGGAWLQLNRGILETTETMTIDDGNRGLCIGPSGGFLNPWQGTTLTIATTINSPAAGNTLQIAPMDSNPIVGTLFFGGGGVVELTNPNNSHNAPMDIGWSEVRLSGNGRFNNGDHWMPIVLNGMLNCQTTQNQILRGVISGGGALVKGNSGTLNINGANTFTGSVTVNGGTLYANPGNAATNRAFSYVSGITVNGGGTLRSGANGLFGWDGTQEKPITVNAGGTLSADGNADVGIGIITLAGGTLANLGASATFGSWRFDNATDKLAVTDNSTVSAVNVKFGNAGAAIDVAAGKTLSFTGTITNASSGGVSYLTKTGSGTLTLAAANTYTGATAVNAGTLNLTGSLSGNSAVTVASGATLTGAGVITGNLSFAASSIHSPGNPTGVQTVGGALSYDTGARLLFILLSNSNAAGAANGVAATGALNVTSGAVIDLTFNAAGSSVNFYDTFWTQARTWTLVSSNGMTGTFALGTVTNDSGNKAASSYGTFSLTQGATGATLNWTPKAFAAWRGTKFGANASDAATSGFLANPDGDSLANAWEYFHDTNPSVNSRNPMQTQTIGNRLTVTFPRNTAATDVVATVRGADAVGGPWTDLARSAGGAPFTLLDAGAAVTETGTGSARTVEVKDIYLTSDPAHPKRFLRLSIDQQ